RFFTPVALSMTVIVWPTATLAGALTTRRAPLPGAVKATSGTWSGFRRSAGLIAGCLRAVGGAGAATEPLAAGATPAAAPMVVSGTTPRRAVIAATISNRPRPLSVEIAL